MRPSETSMRMPSLINEQALKYVELELQRVFASHSLRIRFEPSHGSMTIDLATVVSLELIQNLHSANSKDSLYGLLNETLTPMGARLLRANILQPCTERVKLTARYNAVEDLSTKEDMFVSIRQALKGFVDADKVLTSVYLFPARHGDPADRPGYPGPDKPNCAIC